MTRRSAPPLLVVDTDVLIDYLRDQPQAVAFLEGTKQPLAISTITVADLSPACAMARNGGDWMPSWRPLAAAVWPQPRHRPGGWPDPPSAEAAGATLVTLNRRHFPMLAEVLVPYASFPAAVTGFGHAQPPR